MSDGTAGSFAEASDGAAGSFAEASDGATGSFVRATRGTAGSFAGLSRGTAGSFTGENRCTLGSFVEASDGAIGPFAGASRGTAATSSDRTGLLGGVSSRAAGATGPFAGMTLVADANDRLAGTSADLTHDAPDSFAAVSERAAGAFACVRSLATAVGASTGVAQNAAGASSGAAATSAGVTKEWADASAAARAADKRARRAAGMVKPLGVAVAAWLILGVATTGHAQAPALDALLKEVDAAKASVTTLSGEFTQKNRVKLFKQELVAKGKLYFRQPRQIRWEYTTPDPSTLILDGNRATLSSPGAAPQVFDLAKDATMRAIFDQLLVWLGSGSLAQARADYELASGGTAAAPTLLLTPKPASAVARAFARVELRLDGKTHLLRAIALVEQNGDEKEIVFTKLAKNVTLPENAFR